MGKLSGTVLILAGVSIAAYTLSAQQDAGPPPRAITKAPAAPAVPVYQIAERTTPPMPSTPPAGAPAVAAPTPANSPPSDAKAAHNATAAPVAPAPAAQPKAGAVPAANPLHAAPTPSLPGPQKLRPGTPTAVRVAEAPPRLPVGETAATASPPLDRPALTREIQRHLKRIGCYRGDANGVWTPSVRQAVKDVTDRVNASLPIDRPDPVLLAMVQGQEPGACGASCPTGQGRAADGRCLPAALVANAGKSRTQAASAQGGSTKAGKAKGVHAKKAQPADDSAITADAPATPQSDGRMSLAGPSAGSNPDASRQANARRKRTRAASNPPRAAYYRPTGPRVRQRSAQRSGNPFWGFPFFMP
jgi:hypothetical protein